MRVAVVLVALLFSLARSGATQTARAQTDEKKLPAGVKVLTRSSYPTVCRAKMIRADSLAERAIRDGGSVERYLMGRNLKMPRRRTAAWMITIKDSVETGRMLVLFAWDVGGSLCTMETHNAASVGKSSAGD